MTARRKVLLPVLLLCALAAGAFQAATHPRPTPKSLAAMVPQGALLTIESPDFAGLIHQWSSSAECAAWMKSDNYAVFSNSRLFSRLVDAQGEFTATAFRADAPDPGAFLDQIAGKQSIFAWYDVSNLEFLYITRMPSTQALQTALVKQRLHFQARQARGQTFYVRTSGSSATGNPRTVAFATVTGRPGGDLLLLATREDLVVNALALLASPGAAVDQEPWHADAEAALQSRAPALHMVLNLDRLVPLASFRTYWVQGNVTEMKQFRSAASDLYLEGNHFREERALLPKTPEPTTDADPDLASLAALAPSTSVFRVTATHDPAVAIAALEEKLLGRPKPAEVSAKTAPEASLDATRQGSSTDLDTRIDTPPPVSATFSNQALADVLAAAHLDSVLTVATAVARAEPSSLWVPIHSAVVLHGTEPFSAAALQAAVQQSLRGSLTASSLGIDFRPATVSGQAIFALTGPKPLFLALAGSEAFLSDDQALLLQLLASPPRSAPTPGTLLAGFSHTAQRPAYARLTGLIDRTNDSADSADAADPATNGSGTPAYFSRNLRSLSDSFARLESERLLERHDGFNLRQTVTYQWKQ